MQNKGKRWGPCPSCNNDRTGNDSRLPVVFSAYRSEKNNRWICNACSTTGNMFDLVSWYTNGCAAGDLKGKGSWAAMYEFFTGESATVEKSVDKWVAEPVAYPPHEEVRAILDASTPLHMSKDKKVLEWCRQRGFDPRRLLHGPRVINQAYDFHSLTSVDENGSWWPQHRAKRYPVIIPMVDYKGNLRSFVGRPLYKTIRPKSMFPRGYAMKNLYFVNVPAWKFLTRKTLPSDIIIAEGEIDFLSVAQHDYPVIGITGGSTGHLHMMPWKVGQTVHVACDNDKAGNKLAKKIPNSIHPALARRCHLDKLGGKA